MMPRTNELKGEIGKPEGLKRSSRVTGSVSGRLQKNILWRV